MKKFLLKPHASLLGLTATLMIAMSYASGSLGLWVTFALVAVVALIDTVLQHIAGYD